MERHGQRSKVLARTSKEYRGYLEGKSPQSLAENVTGIGESMAREAARFETMRATIQAGMDPQTSRKFEAHHLAHARADLLAICDEMRLRIDHLLAGKDIGCGR